MTKDKAMTVLKILIVLVVLVTACNIYVRNLVIEKMNEQELHYDADGYFLMLDTQNGLLGIYDVTEPLEHILVGDQLPNGVVHGVYITHCTEDKLILLSGEEEPIVLIIENTVEIPEGTPVLVY